MFDRLTSVEDRRVLLSTHIVSDVEYIANEILLMKDDMLLRINKFVGDFVFSEIGGTIFGVYTVLIPCYLFLSLVLFPMIYYGYKNMGAAPARAGR